MMTNVSLMPTSPTSAKQESYTVDDGRLDSCDCLWYFTKDINLVVIFSFICIVSIFGLVGNGTVIWLLVFRVKRNPFTIYILNLAVTDFGVLIFVFFSAVLLNLRHSIDDILPYFSLYVVSITLFRVMFSISQFLLTVISIDRCVSVTFPIWYRCHRPEKLSMVLCALIWIFCFLLHGILIALERFEVFEKKDIPLYVFLVTAMVCLPFITISTMILFIRFCFNSQQRRRKKLFMAILLTLFFFLFFAFPLNIIYLIHLQSSNDDLSREKVLSFSIGYLCASVNSFVNPLIYFLVGRKKRGLCRENLKLILQRVFKQEEDVYGEDPQSSVQSEVPA